MSDEAWRGDEPSKRRGLSFKQEIDALLKAEPFVPSDVAMNSGERFVVISPFSLNAAGSAYVIYTRGGYSRLRMNAVSHVDVPEAPSI